MNLKWHSDSINLIIKVKRISYSKRPNVLAEAKTVKKKRIEPPRLLSILFFRCTIVAWYLLEEKDRRGYLKPGRLNVNEVPWVGDSAAGLCPTTHRTQYCQCY